MKHNIIIALPVHELKNALPGFNKIIGRKTTLPVLSAIRVDRNSSGLVTLQGTDLDSTATFTVRDRNEGPASSLLVPFDRLQKAVNQSNGRVELSATGKEEVLIRTFWRDTPMEEKVHVPKNDEWPRTPLVAGEPVKLNGDFRATFREAMECASTEESRSVINSVYLDVEDKQGHYVVATNGSHLFAANSFAFGFRKSVIIPTRKFLAWNGWWTEGDATLAIRPAAKADDIPWLQFRADQWTFLTKGQPLEYPRWRNVVPNEDGKTKVIIPGQAIASVLEVLARLPGEDNYNKGVTLNASGTTFVLSGRNKEQAQTVSVPIIEAEIKGVPVIVTLNRDYVIRALKFGLNEIDIMDELTPVVFQTTGRKMIVSPLHPDCAAPATPAAPPAPAPEAQAQAQPQPTTPTHTETTATTTTPPAEPTKPDQERTTMPRQENTTTTHTNEQPDSPLKLLIQQIESIKTTLKNVLGELNTALDGVKKAEKEKKLMDREIEAIREKVREIQNVSI